ncbi:MAG: MATE family efflux transporter [Hyphomicrobiales bacterium]|nr:MAG: MATE family efflux transporter [Hyphomicrobiales bacterium]
MSRARAVLPFEVTHRGVLAIAVPMTLAYLSTPLVGLTDTAVIGRLGDAALLGGIAIGAIVFDVLFTTFNFLRAGTTGLTAQAFGADDVIEQRAILVRSVLVALAAGLVVIVLRQPLLDLGMMAMSASAEVEAAGRSYFEVRIYATPFVLLNYTILGWFLGLGRARTGLLLQLLLNGVNIVLDIYFVAELGWGVEGAAAATLIAEALTAIAGGVLALAATTHGERPAWSTIFCADAFKTMFAVNRDIMIRSFSLLAAFAFFTREGARAGDITLAANAILMNLFLIGGYFLDGFATAAEQLAGRAIGARWRPAFDRAVTITFVWSIGLGGMLSAIFFAFGPMLIDGLTTNGEVRDVARVFLFWAALTPIVGAVAFQMDGVFIGSTWSDDMRNMMLASLAAYFAIWWFAVPVWGNHGLWLALLAFLGLRGVSLYWRLIKRRERAFASPGMVS